MTKQGRFLRAGSAGKSGVALVLLLVNGLLPGSWALAGPTPGLASPWNGPWGGGYLHGEPYSPLANPAIGAGYPLATPPWAQSANRQQYGGQGLPSQDNPPAPRQLPGGGFVIPPAAGGGMLPGAYSRY